MNLIPYHLLCKQKVTVYRLVDGAPVRQVVDGVFFEWQTTKTVDKLGQKQERTFLLILPGAEQTVYPGDKIYQGEGPELTERNAWSAFIPSKVPGLVVAKACDPITWQGKNLHWEVTG